MKDNQMPKEYITDPKWQAKDWQFRPMRDGETFAIFTGKLIKRIPIEMWEEIGKGQVMFANDLLTTYLMPIEIRNSGGKTYLVTIKEQL